MVNPTRRAPASVWRAGALEQNLDSLDGRFQNAGIQDGDFYYQVTTTADFGVATPRYYIIRRIALVCRRLAMQSDVSGSGRPAYDFNHSIGTITRPLRFEWSDTTRHTESRVDCTTMTTKTPTRAVQTWPKGLRQPICHRRLDQAVGETILK